MERRREFPIQFIEDERMAKTKSAGRPKKPTTTYVNVNRTKKGYRDKYKKLVEDTLREYKRSMGRPDDYELTDGEWRHFFETFLIPLDKDSERRMIDLFRRDRDQLNKLLVLHNTKAGDNLAEVYYKKYQKDFPTKWHDLEDFRQMALEGLAIAADKFELDSGNRFLTYATWWVLNRVRKPFQAQLANKCHTSLSAPLAPNDADNNTTLEDVLGPDECANGWTSSSSTDTVVNPVAVVDRKNLDESFDLYTTLKNLKLDGPDAIDPDRAHRMMEYLMSIVEGSSGEYGTRQIFLYMFRKVFHKCSKYFAERDPSSTQRLDSYISEAAKSKSELLQRLKMDERQYEAACQKLTKGVYDGI